MEVKWFNDIDGCDLMDTINVKWVKCEKKNYTDNQLGSMQQKITSHIVY